MQPYSSALLLILTLLTLPGGICFAQEGGLIRNAFNKAVTQGLPAQRAGVTGVALCQGNMQLTVNAYLSSWLRTPQERELARKLTMDFLKQKRRYQRQSGEQFITQMHELLRRRFFEQAYLRLQPKDEAQKRFIIHAVRENFQWAKMKAQEHDALVVKREMLTMHTPQDIEKVYRRAERWPTQSVRYALAELRAFADEATRRVSRLDGLTQLHHVWVIENDAQEIIEEIQLAENYQQINEILQTTLDQKPFLLSGGFYEIMQKSDEALLRLLNRQAVNMTDKEFYELTTRAEDVHQRFRQAFIHSAPKPHPSTLSAPADFWD